MFLVKQSGKKGLPPRSNYISISDYKWSVVVNGPRVQALTARRCMISHHLDIWWWIDGRLFQAALNPDVTHQIYKDHSDPVGPRQAGAGRDAAGT